MSNEQERPSLLYAFLYNDCIHESSYQTMSLHYSEEGAKDAMVKHKNNAYQEFLKYDKFCRETNKEFYEQFPNKFGEHEDWAVDPVEVLP